jgi:hypothetical protein
MENCKEITIKSAYKILTCDIKSNYDWFDEDCNRYIEVRKSTIEIPTETHKRIPARMSGEKKNG